eukprot:s440_g18.t1
MVLWMFFGPVLLEDGRRRGVFVGKPDEWEAREKAQFALCAALPVFGGVAWLLSRPPLPEQRLGKSSETLVELRVAQLFGALLGRVPDAALQRQFETQLKEWSRRKAPVSSSARATTGGRRPAKRELAEELELSVRLRDPMAPERSDMTPSCLQQLLETRRKLLGADTPAREFPEKVAIRSPDGFSCTFSELRASISSLASALLRSELCQGERVAWLLPNGLEALQLSCACYQVAAISVPINLRYSAPEVAYMVSKVQAKMLFLHSKLQLPGASQLASEVVDIPGPAWDAFRARAAPAVTAALRPVPPEQPALILFTSGTTGHPKGVLHSHGGCWAAIQTSAETFGLRSDDVVLVGKPISHAGGLQTQLLPTLARGGEAVLTTMPTAAQALELIQRFNVSVYAMLSSALLDFVEHLEQRPQLATSVATLALRRVMGSGDSVPLQLQRRFLEMFGWPVLEGCGITEIGGYYAAQPLDPRDREGKAGSMGRPTKGTQVRLVEDGEDDGKDVPSGSIGEVLLKTASLPLGYWEDPEATKELFQDGWLRTGDLARFDSEGFLWFVARRKLIIVRRGSNLAPAAVERRLLEHSKVKATVVVGVPDFAEGEVPVAWVVAEEHAARGLASYEQPVRYWFRDAMPLNSVGKFDRAKLKEEAKEMMAKLAATMAGA